MPEATAPSDDKPLRQWRSIVAPGCIATLTYYPPFAGQPAHCHDHLQLSILLAGDMREELRAGDFDMTTAAIGLKPAGTWHADRWGPSGALIFSINARPGVLPASTAAGHWRRCDARSAARIACAMVDAGDADRTELAYDLFAAADPVGDMRRSSPPRWLVRARESLDDDPTAHRIASIAASAGVHRVHLAREFTRHYGLSPSAYRRRRMVSRLVSAALVSPAQLTGLAHEAGFADQSHAVRAVRDHLGIGLARLRRMMTG